MTWRKFPGWFENEETIPHKGSMAFRWRHSWSGALPQNLRLYESKGLLTPARTDGGTRLYSENDLERLRLIGRLLEDGLNLAGIIMVLGLQEENLRLQLELDESSRPLPQDPNRR